MTLGEVMRIWGVVVVVVVGGEEDSMVAFREGGVAEQRRGRGGICR